MPVYEYACQACGHEFEREQRITEDPIKTCPECKAKKAKRLISRTSFVLKGGGWYSDLYSSSGGDKGDKGDKADKADSAAGKTEAGSGDAKPAASESKKKSGKGGGKGKGGSSKSGGKGGKGAKAAA